MSNQDVGDDASLHDPDWDAIEARFTSEAFAGVARALGLPLDPQTLSKLKRFLIDPLHFFYDSCGDKPSRAERIEGLSKLRDAARILLRGHALGLTLETWEASWDE